ncbi:hypothetical protein GE061_010809 [Apolygus lucorum]|uniref:Activator of basal transcription 1 n=1 Tax=Apolygus lucorum TaxID=248454 RepID=A0A8S9XWW4_APOLU|nr:hypothetical protein GE061_010809 [Apolygus lucorum]
MSFHKTHLPIKKEKIVSRKNCTFLSFEKRYRDCSNATVLITVGCLGLSDERVGRMYMQRVEEKGEKKKKKRGSTWVQPDNYSEGWVEFLKKRHAKQVAALLNNQPMGGKKKDRFHDHLWNLKYLSRFKWIHLVERLSFEKAVMRQKMQNEISQAKRVANFFKETVEREERQRKRLKKGNFSGSTEKTSSTSGPSPYVFAQRETVEEKKAKKPQVNEDRENFLKSLFS